MRFQCKACFAVHESETMPLVCNACPCHISPEDSERNIVTPRVAKGTWLTPLRSKTTGKVIMTDVNIRCSKRCKNTVFQVYSPKGMADKPIASKQSYGVDKAIPEMVGTEWMEGYATVAGGVNEAGDTRFFKLKVRIAKQGNAYRVKVWSSKERKWEDKNASSVGFNPRNALTKGSWIKVASIGE